MVEKKDKFKSLRNNDGVIIIHDGLAEEGEFNKKHDFDSDISEEDILKKFDRFKTSDK